MEEAFMVASIRIQKLKGNSVIAQKSIPKTLNALGDHLKFESILNMVCVSHAGHVQDPIQYNNHAY